MIEAPSIQVETFGIRTNAVTRTDSSELLSLVIFWEPLSATWGVKVEGWYRYLRLDEFRREMETQGHWLVSPMVRREAAGKVTYAQDRLEIQRPQLRVVERAFEELIARYGDSLRDKWVWMGDWLYAPVPLRTWRAAAASWGPSGWSVYDPRGTEAHRGRHAVDREYVQKLAQSLWEPRGAPGGG